MCTNTSQEGMKTREPDWSWLGPATRGHGHRVKQTGSVTLTQENTFLWTEGGQTLQQVAQGGLISKPDVTWS